MVAIWLNEFTGELTRGRIFHMGPHDTPMFYDDCTPEYQWQCYYPNVNNWSYWSEI